MRLLLAIALSALAAPAAYSQNVVQVRMDIQPLVYIDAGRVTGCGIRILGVRDGMQVGQFKGFDVSVNFNVSGPSLVKALSYDVTVKEMSSGSGMRNARVMSAWVKADGERGTSPVGGRVLPAEDKGGIIYATEDEVAVGTMLAALEGKTLMVGLRRGDEKGEWVHSGAPAWESKDRERMDNCIRDVASQLKQGGSGQRK